MLRSTGELIGYKLAAAEGPIGKVKDFLFDEAKWTVRWMVADTGDWLPKRKVLISPIALGEPDWGTRQFPVRMTKEEIENSPGLSLDEPVSRAYEAKYFDWRGWPYYWAGAGFWGMAGMPAPLFVAARQKARVSGAPEDGANVLRSSIEVKGYHLQAADGEIGHVSDLVIDNESWAVRYMAVDTRNWLPGRNVLIAPGWVETISWAQHMVVVGLTRDEVKGSPEYRPSEPVNREYETRLYDYYGRPVYWDKPRHTRRPRSSGNGRTGGLDSASGKGRRA